MVLTACGKMEELLNSNNKKADNSSFIDMNKRISSESIEQR
jgi:biotin carboxylase